MMTVNADGVQAGPPGRQPGRITRMGLILGALAMLLALTHASAQDAATRRMRLVRGEPSVAELAEALDDEDVLVARTAARLLPARGEEALPALGRALRHEDMMVRRCAATNLGELGAAGVALIEGALGDDSELVRQGAVYALMDLPHTTRSSELLRRAGDDDSPLVQRAALAASRAAYRTVESIPLAAAGWRIRKDPDEAGEQATPPWFAADLDDSGWDEIAIEQFWGDAHEDYAGYTGVAWYRTTFELPRREPPERTQLAFESVDESTWVWVNGERAGVHDVGPSGWTKPFRIDVTGMLDWGGTNQLTVRVLNTAQAGGIYRPVSVVILKPAE